MQQPNRGFTLIELLIVIAIIGILAAVLIPQLLGARIAANKRALQAHSSTVYKVGIAIVMGENTALSSGQVKSPLRNACASSTGVSFVTVNSVSYKYGWNTLPSGLANFDCNVYTKSGNDFAVIVFGNPGDGQTWYSQNGLNPQASTTSPVVLQTADQ